MDIIFGYGEYHVNLTKQYINEIVRIIEEHSNNPDKLKNELELYRNYKGKFKEKDWYIIDYFVINSFKKYPSEDDYSYVIESGVNHYRDDHPLSPDGYSCLTHKFCITYLNDSTYGKRVYLSFLN